MEQHKIIDLLWVKNVKASQEISETNQLLKEGWKLLQITHADYLPLFILGRG